MKETKREQLKKLQRKIFKNEKQFNKEMNDFILDLKLEIKILHEEEKKLITAIQLCSAEKWIK